MINSAKQLKDKLNVVKEKKRVERTFLADLNTRSDVQVKKQVLKQLQNTPQQFKE